jgi:heme exporter protein B
VSFWSQALEIARVDLRLERRIGDSLRIVLPFAIVSLLIIPLALGARLDLVSEIGPAVFWALGILFGMQIALRHAATDSHQQRDLYALLGVDPAARFVGRTMSGGLLTIGFLLALFLTMLLIYGPGLPVEAVSVGLLASLLLAVGLTELGTLAGDVTADLRNRSTLASLIVAPMAIPLVIGASQSVEALSRGTSILPWILLIFATDLAMAVAGVGLARPLEDATR